jgi:hypothetical protein
MNTYESPRVVVLGSIASQTLEVISTGTPGASCWSKQGSSTDLHTGATQSQDLAYNGHFDENGVCQPG